MSHLMLTRKAMPGGWEGSFDCVCVFNFYFTDGEIQLKYIALRSYKETMAESGLKFRPADSKASGHALGRHPTTILSKKR